MKQKRKCTVEGCENDVHSRGYCRKHYGQIWRKGQIYTNDEGEKISHNQDDMLNSTIRELKRYKMFYRAACSVDDKRRWRKEIDQVLMALNNMGVTKYGVPFWQSFNKRREVIRSRLQNFVLDDGKIDSVVELGQGECTEILELAVAM